jgi:hypothetical protein
MRVFVVLLVLAGCASAQAKPDFSGIFLRTETAEQRHTTPAVPRILEVKQTVKEIVTTATQNGETAVVHYRLDSKKSGKVYARLKGDNLVVKGTITRQWLGPALLVPGFSATENLTKTWELSPDGQRLVIRTKADIGVPDSDTYVREPSMEAAQTAGSAARHDCDAPSKIAAFTRKTPVADYGEGVRLGTASLERLTSSVFYDAVISDDFFKHLEQTEEHGRPRFRKNGQTVTAYTGDIVLEVVPHPNFFSDELGVWEPIGPLPPDPVLNLRFMVRWLGAEQAELGEVQSDLRYEPWREQANPIVFYRMRIPARDIPLTDDLEVVILSETGEQLACIEGHL